MFFKNDIKIVAVLDINCVRSFFHTLNNRTNPKDQTSSIDDK